MKLRGLGWVWCVVVLGCGGASGDASSGSTEAATGGTETGGTTTNTPTTGDEPHVWDAYPAMVCGALFDCGCAPGTLFGATEEQCTQDLAELFNIKHGEGLQWDQACADRMLLRIADQCAPGADAVPQCALDHCALFQGTAPEGEFCDSFDTYWGVVSSTCAPDLRCASSTCVPECGPTGGQPCTAEVASSCADGFECDGGTCSPRGELGDSCASVLCRSDLDCVDDLCAEPPPPGSPCTAFYDCASSSCVDGVCGPMPAGGDPCSADGTCPKDMFCDEESRCRPYACQT